MGIFERAFRGLKNLITGRDKPAERQLLSSREYAAAPGEPNAITGKRPTRRDMNRLRLDQFALKRKLGASFFTRRLSPGTRQKVINSLTGEERRAARAMGWL